MAAPGVDDWITAPGCIADILAACCGSGTLIQTGCCPEGLPTTLHLTVDSPDCPFLDGATCALEFVGFDPFSGWVFNTVSATPFCGGYYQLSCIVRCNGLDWLLNFGVVPVEDPGGACGFGFTLNQGTDVATCDPLHAEFTIPISISPDVCIEPMACPCVCDCVGSFDITVTLTL